MHQPQNISRFTGYFFTLCGAVLFSTKAIIVKIAFSDIDVEALTLLTVRMIFSLPFYIIAAFWISGKSDNIKLTKRQWIVVVFTGMLGYYVSSLLDFTGLQYVSAGLERLILFLYPTFVVLINALFFRVRLNRKQQAALALTYIGIAIAYAGELNIDKNNPNLYYGSFLILMCAITYSVYIVGSGRIIPVIGATKFTAYGMLSATFGIFIHFLLAGDYTTPGSISGLVWYGILLAVVATVIPSFLLSFGMKSIGANNVAIVSGIGPVATIIQAHYFLGESIFPAQIAGTVLVVAGVLLIGWNK